GTFSSCSKQVRSGSFRLCSSRRLPLTNAVLVGIRKAVPSLLALPRVSIRDLPDGHGQYYGAGNGDSPGTLADRAITRFSDRPAHSGGRPAIPPPESGDADHGRTAHRSFDRHPDAAVGQSPYSGGLGGAGGAGVLRVHRFSRRLFEGQEQAKPRPQSSPEAGP